MKIIKPIQITLGKVISSTATEQFGNWVNTVAYAIGVKVVYLDRIYESLIANNTGKQPDISPTSWLNIAPSNKMAMFDSEVNTQTTAGTSLVVELQPSTVCTSIAFLNVKGSQISVEVKDSPGGTVVYSDSVTLDGSLIYDWSTYFFSDFDIKSEVVFQNIPPYYNAVVKITITSADTTAIGNCTIGQMLYIGGTQYGVNFGIRDYSVKETDEFGNTKFVQRAYSKRMSSTVFVENNQLNFVSKSLEKLRATPTVYIATDDSRFEGTIMLGFLKDWNVEVPYPNNSLISLDIEGLI